jgi:hypothetical protein
LLIDELGRQLVAPEIQPGLPRYGNPPTRFVSIKGEPGPGFGWAGSQAIFGIIWVFVAMDIGLALASAFFPTVVHTIP